MKILFVLIMMTTMAIGQNKVIPVYQKKAVVIDSLKNIANQLSKYKKEAQTVIDNVDKEMLILEGRYQSWQSLPDSFIIRYDTLKQKNTK